MSTFRAERFRRTVASAVLVAGMCACAACSSGSAPTGDTELQRRTENRFERDTHSAAVAVIDGDEVRTAYVGADEETVFEIASISKVLTGELLAIAIERGEVSLDDPVGRYLPLGNAPVAAVTLEQLATHASGLPDLTSDPALLAEMEEFYTSGREPPDATVDDLVAFAAREPILPADEPVYGGLGAALLGHALAAAADTDYPALLEKRIFEPLGMDGASAPVTDDDVSPEHAVGYAASGRKADVWADAARAPGNGVHATLDDLVALCRAVIDGPLSDSAALEPIGPSPIHGAQIGYLWHVQQFGDRSLVGHDGVSGGGFSSSILIDRDAGQAAIVLVNEIDDMTRVAFRELELLSESR
jgi:CubicO group peptidase (beta-lactamase class C family)